MEKNFLKNYTSKFYHLVKNYDEKKILNIIKINLNLAKS